LEGKTLLLPRVDWRYRKFFEQILNQEGVSQFGRLEVHRVEVIKRSVLSMVGIKILPEIAVAERVAQKKLATPPWSEGKIDAPTLMIRHRDMRISSTMKAFMDGTKRVMARGDVSPRSVTTHFRIF
jgi:DNA-binding transcriptional LysR family regulator